MRSIIILLLLITGCANAQKPTGSQGILRGVYTDTVEYYDGANWEGISGTEWKKYRYYYYSQRQFEALHGLGHPMWVPPLRHTTYANGKLYTECVTDPNNLGDWGDYVLVAEGVDVEITIKNNPQQ